MLLVLQSLTFLLLLLLPEHEALLFQLLKAFHLLARLSFIQKLRVGLLTLLKSL